MIKIITEAVLTTIHKNQCSYIFLASIHVAIIEREVINESHPGTGESVSLESASHRRKYRNTKIIERIIPVFNFNLVTISLTSPLPPSKGEFQDFSSSSPLPVACRLSPVACCLIPLFYLSPVQVSEGI